MCPTATTQIPANIRHQDGSPWSQRTIDAFARGDSNWLDGEREVAVDDPNISGKTIGEIDRIQGNTFIEDKTAGNAGDVKEWIQDKIFDKLDSYYEARKLVPRYENAPIGMRFTTSFIPADETFRVTVVAAVRKWEAEHSDVSMDFDESAWTFIPFHYRPLNVDLELEDDASSN